MSASKIEWTDRTWNPVTGCTKVSPGCKHCYAERLAPRVFAGQRVDEAIENREDSILLGRPRRFTDVSIHPDRLGAPLRWRKPARVFVNSMSDLFHEAVPDEFIAAVFAVMFEARQHTFQVLTKRPERMRDVLRRIEACEVNGGVEAVSYLMAQGSTLGVGRRSTCTDTTLPGPCRTCGLACPWRTSSAPTSASRSCSTPRRPCGSSARSRCWGRWTSAGSGW